MAARRIRFPEERHASERKLIIRVWDSFRNIDRDHSDSGKPFSQGEHAILTELRKMAKALETAQRGRLQAPLPEPATESQLEAADGPGLIPEPTADEND